MKFLVGLPSIDGRLNINVIHSLLDQLAYIVAEHHQLQCSTVTNTLIYAARNQIAERAVKGGYDYLFFLDSDCIIPPDTLKRLVHHDKDIAAGVYFQKVFPHLPVMYSLNEKGTFDHVLEYPENELIEVGGIGMGCCLIKTSALQRLEATPFDPLPATADCVAINGEDLAFCKRAKAQGIQVYADTGLKVTHQTDRYITEDHFKVSFPEYLKLKKEFEEKTGAPQP